MANESSFPISSTFRVLVAFLWKSIFPVHWYGSEYGQECVWLCMSVYECVCVPFVFASQIWGRIAWTLIICWKVSCLEGIFQIKYVSPKLNKIKLICQWPIGWIRISLVGFCALWWGQFSLNFLFAGAPFHFKSRISIEACIISCKRHRSLRLDHHRCWFYCCCCCCCRQSLLLENIFHTSFN